MRGAAALSKQNILKGSGGPFGAVIVKDGAIIAEGVNLVTATHDPTAHAEITAIRIACKKLGTFQLQGCSIYCSCEPCPMCFAAIFWARMSEIFYANSREDASAIGFDDSRIYKDVALDPKDWSIPTRRIADDVAREAFDLWNKSSAKVPY